MLKVSGLFIAAGALVFLAFATLVWKLIGRPFAVSMRFIPKTAYDYLVLAWKAERRGDWKGALAAYEEALSLNPRHPDAKEKQAKLLAAHPKLMDRSTR